ncbi:MAG TPA: gluconate 2-dehydrogenase subunit 3 family protein [Roseiflexaceae bacterium]|nr:gluconate 2-dehydrogenase subunit 3 family protein [Roseiflexaceae bacterium]
MLDEPPNPLTLFSDRQVATLRALIDRLIPPDDFPGGWAAGVGDYLAHQLVGDLRPLLEQYRAGLDALDGEAQATAGAPFAALEAGAQDALLGQVEVGAVVTPWPVDPAVFFHAAVAHAGEGYYGDPGNGGNHDAVAWRMVGFEVRG